MTTNAESLLHVALATQRSMAMKDNGIQKDQMRFRWPCPWDACGKAERRRQPGQHRREVIARVTPRQRVRGAGRQQR